jgi:hypothetical protein
MNREAVKMKRFMKASLVALAITALTSISAIAGDKGKVEKKTVTFTEDIMVNGTLVKKGDYEIKFDDSTGELSVIKNGKVKAKTSAHYEARSDKAKTTALRTIGAAQQRRAQRHNLRWVLNRTSSWAARGSVSGTQ